MNQLRRNLIEKENADPQRISEKSCGGCLCLSSELRQQHESLRLQRAKNDVLREKLKQCGDKLAEVGEELASAGKARDSALEECEILRALLRDAQER